MLKETKQNVGESLMAQFYNAVRQYSNLQLSLAAIAVLLVATGCGDDDDRLDVDLIVTEVTAPLTIEAGSTFTIVASVENTGSDNARGRVKLNDSSFDDYSGFRVGIYLSENPEIKRGSDDLLASWNFDQLYRGSILTRQKDVRLPSKFAPGTYYLGVFADDKREQEETDNRNNTFVIEITVTAPVPAATPVAKEAPVTELVVEPIEMDLAVANVMEEGSGVYSSGDLIAIDNTIDNIGTETAYLVTVTFYASADPEITANDCFLGQTTIDTMAPGAMDQDLTLCMIPESLPAGTYFIGTIVDINNDWPEYDETNNSTCASSSIEVVTTR